MKPLVLIIMILYIISPVDLAPGLIDDLIVFLVSGGYLMSGGNTYNEDRFDE